MYYATFAQKIQYLSEFFDRLSLAMQRKDEKEEMKEENKKAACATFLFGGDVGTRTQDLSDVNRTL